LTCRVKEYLKPFYTNIGTGQCAPGDDKWDGTLSQVVKVNGETDVVIGNLCFCPLFGAHSVDWWSSAESPNLDGYINALNLLKLYDPENPRVPKTFSDSASVKAYLAIGCWSLKYRLSAQLAAFKLDALYDYYPTDGTWDGIRDWVIINLGNNYNKPVLRDVASIIESSDSALTNGNRGLQMYWLNMLEYISTNTPRMVSWSSCWGCLM
jgi:hypothetical protein